MNDPRPMRILLAEDDASLRNMTAELLELSGYAVTAVDRGQKAIEAFDRECPNLVVADIAMPEGDGYAILRHIRGHRTAPDVPVIFLTGKSGLDEIRAGLRDGVDDYLTKPFDPDDLLHSIAQRIERRSRQLQRLENLKISLGAALPYELRTPLCGILGYAELLRDAARAGGSVPAAEVAEAAGAQLASCESLMRVIDGVCLWLEVSAGSAELVGLYGRARAAGWVPTATHDAEEIARRYGREAELTVQLEDGAVSVPPAHWRTLFCQMVDAAFRSSPRGTKVEVTGRREHSMYHLRVHDAGNCAGGPETGSLGPFSPPPPGGNFSRGQSLGMAIVRQVAALAGGDFSIGSAANGGTAAVVSVPVALQEFDPGAMGPARCVA
jgi:CheY-like chemotaxis protein